MVVTRVLNSLPMHLGNIGIDKHLADSAANEFFTQNGPERPVSAVFRVKNAEHTLLPSFLSILPLVAEVVVVDNMSGDATEDAIATISDICERLKINFIFSRYSQDISRHGLGYKSALAERPETSIAKYYEFAFSLATKDYLLKADSSCLFFPRAIRAIVHMLNQGRPLIRFRGQEIFGKTMAYEPSLFSREIYRGFIDCEESEIVRFSKPMAKYDIRNFYFPPAFLHYRRVAHRHTKILGADLTQH